MRPTVVLRALVRGRDAVVPVRTVAVRNEAVRAVGRALQRESTVVDAPVHVPRLRRNAAHEEERRQENRRTAAEGSHEVKR